MLRMLRAFSWQNITLSLTVAVRDRTGASGSCVVRPVWLAASTHEGEDEIAQYFVGPGLIVGAFAGAYLGRWTGRQVAARRTESEER